MNIDTTSIAGYTIFREEDTGSSAIEKDLAALAQQDPVHPLDQLSIKEISLAAKSIRRHVHPKELKFNCITLREPPKAEYVAFREHRGPRPDRKAFAIVLEKGGGTTRVAEVVVNLTKAAAVETWKDVSDVCPTLTLEDLDVTERVCRADPRFAAACRDVGITDMTRVYIDAWAIGVDERWSRSRRLQQGLVYYRNSALDNQYAHPLDFSVVVDTEAETLLSVDIRRVNGERTAVPLAEHNFLPPFIGHQYVTDALKPIDITQPQGVSFRLRGNELSWAQYRMHIGFNYREGIVLSDVRVQDPSAGRERMLFHRLSVVEMVVPYGEPSAPHHKKHAFDVGEYGAGLMTNPLRLGCDCKGAIHYLDAVVSTARGDAALVPNAICIHEEDNGLLYKHTDYRDGTVVTARDRRLIVSQIITAANYDYCFYHIFTLDGTYKLEIRLTGQLNTACMHPSETAAPYGTEVAPRINAHNHQHIFSLRVDPAIDGPNNSVVMNDAVPADDPVGAPGNPRRDQLPQRHQPLVAPVGYTILNNNCPPLLAKPGSVVAKRAAFARESLWVVPYRDYELFPAGDYVPQSTGGGEGHPHNAAVLDWVARDESVVNTDIVCYVQFGLTHFPRCEDFPIMPAEPVSVMLRASNFYDRNPALWVPPSAVAIDTTSQYAFAASADPAKAAAAASAGSCCSGNNDKSKL
ncbi:peroxisomal copper amine oxidase [Niveomyces insectorum RCEF 264]|uniref:Amine oxidase n=1 Tax=Niveomyces insectorum RCEF 264 TaxID=1081102 RepID=A0A167WYE7_9HYPO|nr:peroxisomal copper amine oxidase [Niveomyces insectorum RCEF 264]